MLIPEDADADAAMASARSHMGEFMATIAIEMLIFKNRAKLPSECRDNWKISLANGHQRTIEMTDLVCQKWAAESTMVFRDVRSV